MRSPRISHEFDHTADAVVFQGDCLDFLRSLPDETFQLIITSPPYNIGKSYERRVTLADYVEGQRKVIRESTRTLRVGGSICWQVGNYVTKSQSAGIVPLDIALFPIFAELGLVLRNRIIWHFEHGLHCSKRFSGRHETILWFTKGDTYHFDLDAVRVPQKYPGKKYFKGPKAGQYSCNPLGKNPGDVWTIPNVKANHVEKTDHPCQFPMELVERFILTTTNPGDWILDPYLGVGTTTAAAVKNQRRGAGAEFLDAYAKIAIERTRQAAMGTLKSRAMGTPVFDPAKAGQALRTVPWQRTATADADLFSLVPETGAKTA